MALKINYPEPGDNVPQWATEDTQLQIKAILERDGKPATGGKKADKEKEEQTKKSTKALKQLAEGFDELTGLVGTTAGVITSTKGEFKDLIPIVDNFGNLVKKATGALFTAIPIFGDALKAGGDLFVEFSKDAFSFLATTLDTVVAGFRDVATRGAFFEQSLTGLVEAASRAKINVEDLGAVLAMNSSALASFSNTNLGATQIIKNLGEVQKQYGDDLFALGLTFDEINEASSGFFNLLASTGQASLLRAGQEGQLAAVTNRYIKDLTALASITGQERKEVEAEFRRQVMRGNVQAQLALMEQQGIEGGMSQFGSLAVILEKFNPMLGDAFSSIATLGVATAEQEAVLAQLGNSRQLIEEFGQSFRDGTLTDAEAKRQTEAIFNAISTGVKSPEFLELAKIGVGPVAGLPATLAEVASSALEFANEVDSIDFAAVEQGISDFQNTSDETINLAFAAQKQLADIPFVVQNALLGEKGGVPVINAALESVATNVKQFGGVLEAIITSGGDVTALLDIFGGEKQEGNDYSSPTSMYNQFQTKLMGVEDKEIKAKINEALDAVDLSKVTIPELQTIINELIRQFDLDIANFNQGTAGVQNFGNGTLAMLHGNEAVIPAPMGSIPVDLGNTLAPLQELITNLTNSMDTGNQSVSQVDQAAAIQRLVDTPSVNSVQSNEVVSKLNEMIGVLKTIADGQYTGNSQFGKEIRRLGNQMSTDLFR